ncbi:MAG: carboxylating nicotinate-nucleotide diphosphorylase [Deltaproteobacteria bacterium]|nr:carboxylating nicotinate-nucleotide diphosphorylase [Deltaproteobacteria bacterium]
MKLPQPEIRKLVLNALREDAAFHDITTLAIVPKNRQAKAILLAKQDLILCGMPIVEATFRALDPKLKIRRKFKEGEKVRKGQAVAELSGSARTLLSGERVALNFLQRLSGIATLTRSYVEAVRGTRAKILDTRKTTPGLRSLERYAVATGGGTNHRFDLRSAAMAKDNHLAIAGSAEKAFEALAGFTGRKEIIIEVKNAKELRAALSAGASRLLLDNMSIPRLRESVLISGGKARLEASGGVTLKNVRQVAGTGVDFISVGALTHSAPAVDISLEIGD